jgi:hypothetical protein
VEEIQAMRGQLVVQAVVAVDLHLPQALALLVKETMVAQVLLN